eukprot:7386008-Prymnesium_polylepis.1
MQRTSEPGPIPQTPTHTQATAQSSATLNHSARSTAAPPYMSQYAHTQARWCWACARVRTHAGYTAALVGSRVAVRAAVRVAVRV